MGYEIDEVKAAEDQDVLYATLRSLEMEILDWRDVMVYKAQELTKVIDRQVKQAVAADAYNDSALSWPPRWDEHKISKYRERVPDHILQKAIEIKRLLPECQINVQKLDESTDPFLVALIKVGYTEVRYFIDVWDEPGFERR